MPTKLTSRERELAKLTLQREDSLLKQLKKVYRNAFTGVKQVIQQLLGIKLLSQSQIYQLKYQKQLAKNLQQALKPLKSSNLSTFEEYLKESYSNGYIGTLYNMQKQGVPLLLPMDKRQMLKAISRTNDDIKLSTKLHKDIDKLADTVRHEITRGIAVGASYQDIARNVSYRGNVSLNNAMRIARTEGGRINHEAVLNAMQDMEAKGAKIVKQWCSTLDGKTRETHQQLDGVILPINEYFVTSDGKRALHPQAFYDPAEDCNCRCVLQPRAEWALEDKSTRYNNETGEIIECKDYTEFKEKYLQKTQESSIIKERNKLEFIPANSIQEAEKFARETLGIGCNYKGIDLQVANEMNAAFARGIDICPEIKEQLRMVGSGQECNKAFKAEQLEYWNKKLRERYPNATEAWYTKEANRLSKVKSIDSHSYAFARKIMAQDPELNAIVQKYQGIFVNNKFGRDSTIFLKGLADDVSAKWHPIGCDTIASVFDHEMAHILDYTLGLSNNSEMRKLFYSLNVDEITNGLSGYAIYQNQIQEFIAEGWAEYCNSPKPRKIATEIANIILQGVKRK